MCKSLYKKINTQFRKILIFHLGIDAGFFSEYGSMINMIIYCLEHQIQFKLYSKDANFGYKDGWRDYFEPFCDEVNDKFHHYCNFHSRQSFSGIWKSRKEIKAPTVRWKIKLELFNILGIYHKIRTANFNYFTQDLYDKIQIVNKHFFIPELGIDGDYIQAFKVIDSIVWRFNSDMQRSVDTYIKNANLPSNYIACQIRGGDKIIEFSLCTIEPYILKIREIASVKDVFVLTDDYDILLKLREAAPDINWYSFCQATEHGYYNSVFSQMDISYKKEQMVRFFSAIQVLKSSSFFIGSLTSAPSCYIANIKYPNIAFVDLDEKYTLSYYNIPWNKRKEYLKNE